MFRTKLTFAGSLLLVLGISVIALAVPLPEPAKVEKPAHTGKSDPPGVPLEARLTAKTDTYILDLGGKTAKEFRQMLQTGNAAAPSPKVELELEFKNTGEKDIEFIAAEVHPLRSGTLSVKGPSGSVITRTWSNPAMGQPAPPKKISLAPGKSHTIPITGLMYGFNPFTVLHWSEPREYTVTVTLPTRVSPAPPGVVDPRPKGAKDDGFGRVTLTSNPVKLKVVDSRRLPNQYGWRAWRHEPEVLSCVPA